MYKNHPMTLPAMTLIAKIYPGDIRRILLRALEWRNRTDRNAKKALEKGIDKWVSRQGIRGASKLPSSTLVKHIMDIPADERNYLPIVYEVYLPLLNVWITSWPELRDIVTEFLKTSPFPKVESEEISIIRQHYLRLSQVNEAIEKVKRVYPTLTNAHKEDVKFMISCLSGKGVAADEKVEVFNEESLSTLLRPAFDKEYLTDEASKPLLWDEWIVKLRNLPPEAREWDEYELGRFIEAVAELSVEKTAAYRAVLQDMLKKLLADAAEEIDYFGLTDQVASWSPQHIPHQDMELVGAQLLEWKVMLQEHAYLRKWPAKTLNEDKQRQTHLNQLQSKIDQWHTELKDFFTPPFASEETEEEPKATDVALPVIEKTEIVEEVSSETVVPGTPSDLVGIIATLPEPLPIETLTPEALLMDESGDETETISVASDEKAAVLAEEEPVTQPAGGEGIVVDTVSTVVTSVKVQTPLAAPSLPVTVSSSELEESEAAALPRSSREIAGLLHTQDEAKYYPALLWALVDEDDLPAAYWLARSLEAAEQETLVSSWLLAAIQGARWLTFESELFFTDLMGIVTDWKAPGTEVESMLGLAAALRGALVAPITGLADWLATPHLCPAAHDLVTAIEDFSRLGISLRPEDLLGVAGAAQREAVIVGAAQQAKMWMDEAPTRRTNLGLGSSIWLHFVSPHNGELRPLLEPVAKDRRFEMGNIIGMLEQWQDKDFVNGRITQIYRDLTRSGKTQELANPVRAILVRGIEEACERVKYWADLVLREHQIEQRGSWLFERVGDLRTRVQNSLRPLEIELAGLSEHEHLPLAAAARCLWRTVEQLREDLDIPADPALVGSLLINKWEWLPIQADNLEIALGRRLLWLPETFFLDAQGLPVLANLPDLAMVLSNNCLKPRSLTEAFEGWLQAQDYRFVETMLRALSSESDPVELSRRFQEALAGSKMALKSTIIEAETAIEQTFVDALIADEDRAAHTAVVEAVKANDDLDFRHKHNQLMQVRAELVAARQRRVAQLTEIWHELSKALEESGIDHSRRTQIQEAITTAIERGDIRILEEYLSHLRNAMEAGEDIEESWTAPISNRDALQEYLDLLPKLDDWLGQVGLEAVAESIRDGRGRADLKLGEVPGKRLQEAADVLMTWRRLKQSSPSFGNHPQNVGVILRYLGFELAFREGVQTESQTSGPHWLHLRVPLSASEFLARPIPQFGSRLGQRTDVVCFWERPGADTIASKLQELKIGESVIVLYLGRLSMRQRRELTQMSHKRKLAASVVDETLLIFLAQERGARLPTFLRCTLPFSALNPYTPFFAGDVPPEIFYGREEMARELQRPMGSCLVYGGRQLGKSALLRHVQRQFHAPEREQYSWVTNLKLIFDPAAGKTTTHIWLTLRDQFKEQGLLSPRIRTENPTEIFKYLRETIIASGERRVLVLFDEADEFLDADARDEFRTVQGLKELMVETGRRFKIVFAGLHNVQRFQQIPNQPLAHYGSPLRVGPLEPVAAQQLVQDPLECLGYRISESAVLRVLSYSNYHPGLLQLLCQQLLDKLQTKAANTQPPRRVDQMDIEAIYVQTRASIRERFDWTLALDMRYQAIAWTLIEDQIKQHDSYSMPYTPGQVLSMVQGWWPQGFQNISIDELRGLLDEMVGLGVLVRTLSGHYRLRSPNLVRLMGTEADTENRLLELSAKELPKPPDANNYHAALDRAAIIYNPLTYAQERSLNLPHSAVDLVFASEALGFSTLPHAIKRFIPPDLPESLAACIEIPLSASTADRFSSWLEEQLRSQNKLERLICYHKPTRLGAETLASLVDTALDVCARRRAHANRVQIVFILDPAATWTWLSLPLQRREDLENRADAALFVRRWNTIGIRQRLAQHQKMHSDEICQSILQATSGWPMLLDVLFERSKEDDPRPVAQQLEVELSNSGALRQKMAGALGFIEKGPAYRVAQFILREQGSGISSDFITPEWISGEPTLTLEQCQGAIEYLQRMNLVVVQDGLLTVEPLAAKIVLGV